MRAAPPFHFQRLIANCQTANSGMLFFVNLVIVRFAVSLISLMLDMLSIFRFSFIY